MAVVARDARHSQAQKRVAKRPEWLAYAMDPRTELLPADGAIHTIDYEYNGKTYVAPTVRKEKEGLVVLSDDEAMNEGIRRGDHILVPEGMTGTEFSKELSEIVGRVRKNRGRSASRSAEKAR